MPIELPQPESKAPAGTFDLPVAGDAAAPFSAAGAGGAKNNLPAPKKHKPVAIAMAVLSAGLVALLAVIVVYHRSSRESAYTNTIYVWGRDDSWDGATVEVSGGSLPEPFFGKLTKSEHLACRFHVPPGKYNVIVEKDRRTIERVDTRPEPWPTLKEHEIWFPFRRLPSPTQPAAQ